MRPCGKIYEGAQRTPEWNTVKAGKLSASKLKDILPSAKTGKFKESREDTMIELITERLTGIMTPTFQNDAMRWGVAMEPSARDAYCKKTGSFVREVMFVDHPTIAMTGVSPDGLSYSANSIVINKGLDNGWPDFPFGNIEIKCPHTKNHFATILSEKWDEQYEEQMTMQMGCMGADWTDFVSYDPRLPEEMQLYIARFPFDEQRWNGYVEHILAFNKELDERLLKLKKRFGLPT